MINHKRLVDSNSYWSVLDAATDSRDLTKTMNFDDFSEKHSKRKLHA